MGQKKTFDAIFSDYSAIKGNKETEGGKKQERRKGHGK